MTVLSMGMARLATANTMGILISLNKNSPATTYPQSASAVKAPREGIGDDIGLIPLGCRQGWELAEVVPG
jgi:hypothetical protein